MRKLTEIPSHRLCPKCQTVKLASGFTLRGGNRIGLQCWCKKCYSAWKVLKRAENPAASRAAVTKYRKKDVTKYRLSDRARHLGVEPELITSLEIKQQGRCAICGTVTKLHFDHCHRTGKFRELLCGNCNRAIGLMHDNPRRLDAAANYLRKHKSKTMAQLPLFDAA